MLLAGKCRGIFRREKVLRIFFIKLLVENGFKNRSPSTEFPAEVEAANQTSMPEM